MYILLLPMLNALLQVVINVVLTIVCSWRPCINRIVPFDPSEETKLSNGLRLVDSCKGLVKGSPGTGVPRQNCHTGTPTELLELHQKESHRKHKSLDHFSVHFDNLWWNTSVDRYPLMSYSQAKPTLTGLNLVLFKRHVLALYS